MISYKTYNSATFAAILAFFSEGAVFSFAYKIVMRPSVDLATPAPTATVSTNSSDLRRKNTVHTNRKYNFVSTNSGVK